MLYSKKSKINSEKVSLLAFSRAKINGCTASDNSHLGEKVDIAFEYKAYEHVKIQGGYSQVFASSSMKMLRGHGNHEELANWFWLQAFFIFKQ